MHVSPPPDPPNKSLYIWGRAHYLPLLTCWILLGPHGSPTSSGELSTPRDSVVKVYTYDKIIAMVMVMVVEDNPTKFHVFSRIIFYTGKSNPSKRQGHLGA